VARAREATRGEERGRDWEDMTRGLVLQLEVEPGDGSGCRGARVCGQERRGKRPESRGDDAWMV
jgi:hypothetical protein